MSLKLHHLIEQTFSLLLGGHAEAWILPAQSVSWYVLWDWRGWNEGRNTDRGFWNHFCFLMNRARVWDCCRHLAGLMLCCKYKQLYVSSLWYTWWEIHEVITGPCCRLCSALKLFPLTSKLSLYHAHVTVTRDFAFSQELLTDQNRSERPFSFDFSFWSETCLLPGHWPWRASFSR